MKRSGKKKMGLGQGVTIVLVVLVIAGVFFAISKSHEILAWVESQQKASDVKR